MSTLLRSLNCVSRCSTRPASAICRPLPTKYFTHAIHPATSSGARTITSSHSRPHETTLLQFIQDRIAYATHRSRLFRPLSRSGRPSGRFDDGNEGGSRGPWFNNIPDNAVIWGILGLNGLIYLAWQRAKYDYVRPTRFMSLVRSLIVQPFIFPANYARSKPFRVDAEQLYD